MIKLFRASQSGKASKAEESLLLQAGNRFWWRKLMFFGSFALILLFSVLATKAQEGKMQAENTQAEDTQTEEQFYARLENFSSQNKTIVARFEQCKQVPGIKKQLTREGDFYYDNEGLMAMIYDSPAGDKVLMRGEEFTIVVGGKTLDGKASSNPMMAQIAYMMQASMTGDIAKFGQGWSLCIAKVDAEYEVVIKPSNRRIQKYINAMTMRFCDETMTLNELRIDEANGGFTVYRFSEKQINRSIDRQIFIP